MTRDRSGSGGLLEISQTLSLREALAQIAARLTDAGIDGAQADARFLVQGILGIAATDLLRDPDRPVGARASLLEDAVRRRLAREPVSRILGTREFYGRTFEITPDVLDPRADTETLIDLVLDVVRARPHLQRDITIADIGSGSGAILITLLAELPIAHGIAIDVSPAALAVTIANARRHGVDRRMKAVETRGLTGVTQPIDIVVSNPPYIATADIGQLDADVRHYDPALALDGGADGLQIYREIASDIKALERNCWVFLEFGAGQGADVQRIFSTFTIGYRETRADLGGHNRVVALEIHQ